MTSANRERVRLFEPETVAAEYLRVLQQVVGRARGEPTQGGAT
jgi:hypothetical protein